MSYRVIPIGKEFSTKAIQAFESQLNATGSEGWEFVFAFPVVRRTCIFMKEETYLMVLRQRR